MGKKLFVVVVKIHGVVAVKILGVVVDEDMKVVGAVGNMKGGEVEEEAKHLKMMVLRKFLTHIEAEEVIMEILEEDQHQEDKEEGISIEGLFKPLFLSL